METMKLKLKLKLPPIKEPSSNLASMEDYRKGGEGFCRWAEDNVYVPIYPEGSDIAEWYPLHSLPLLANPYTGRSYRTIWEEQKKVCKSALRMENGRFLYRLIVLCWMRGEGKSLLACLIQLWKFFCWPRQQIMLGANSKDQVKFVHYDIMRDIVRNSPNLKAQIHDRDIQEKEIRQRDGTGAVVSIVRSISSFSGIVSNITGYTFSEIFDMKNPKFFVQLDGSIRNIPNALGVIDSTVSAKTHVLYQLYTGALQRKTKKVFFHYRFSAKGAITDYWNPHMDKDQLEDYRAKFPFGEFERYFLNLWSAGFEQIFSPEMVEAWTFMGIDGVLGGHRHIMELLGRKNRVMEQVKELKARSMEQASEEVEVVYAEMEKRLKPLEFVYTLRTPSNVPKMATMVDLERLSDIYDTNWALLVGLDRGDPLKTSTNARTIVSAVAKGLIGSRSTPFLYDSDKTVPEYLYILLHLTIILNHSLEDMKSVIMEVQNEFDGIDSICGERWGTWDLATWCEDESIAFDPIFPTYDKQKAAFTEFYGAARTGRFKCPPLAVAGSKGEDILAEEAKAFDHDIDKRWFGSPEKSEKYGIQDDCIFSVGWCIYGGRLLSIDHFRQRKAGGFFGIMIPGPKGLAGDYQEERR